ncbi:MAG: LPS assembly lipoprotein LptE [Chthoniobacteraceae bacterium]
MITRYFLPLLAVLLVGCAGYRLGPVQPKFMDGVKTIAVPTFKNDTLVPHLEALVANTVIKQVQTDGTYRIASVDNADVIVQGTITEIERKSVRSLESNVLATSEFNLVVHLSYTVTRRSTGEQIDSREVIGQTSFFVGSDIQQDEQQALPLAVQDASDRLVSDISEGW